MSPAVEGARIGTAAGRRLRLIGALVGLLFLLFLLLNLVAFRYGRDQGIYAAVGDTILHGGAPYKDAWDFKPPAIFFLFAATEALLGKNEVAIRSVEAALYFTVPFAFARLARRRSRGEDRDWNAFIGFAGGVFAVYLHVFKEFWHTAQPEGFGAVLLVFALVIVREPFGVLSLRAAAGRWFIAGALAGAAGLLKPPLLGPLPLLLALDAVERARGDRPTIPRLTKVSVAAAVFGAAIPVAATVAYFLAHGAMGDLVSTLFVFAPLYTKLSLSPSLYPTYVRQALIDLTLRFTPILAVSPLVALPVVPASVRRAVDPLGLCAVILPTLLGVALQAKFFPYHYSATLPFAALAATAVVAGTLQQLARAKVPVVALALIAAAVAAAITMIPPDIYAISHFWERVPFRVRALLHEEERMAILDAISSEGDVLAAENRALATWLRKSTRPDARVFLWGFEPVVYGMSERPRASRYLYNVPQRLAPFTDDACATLEADFVNTPPDVIVLEREDRFPWVTGSNDDSYESVSVCPSFAARLGDFDEAWRSQKFVVFTRP